jgi:Virulence factor BrkB
LRPTQGKLGQDLFLRQRTNGDCKLQARRGVRSFFRPRAKFALLKTTYWEWSKDKAPRMGAALAYYTIFSLAPLLIIAVAIAGLAFGMQAAQGEIAGQIQGLVGRDGAKAIEDLIQSAHKPSHGVIGSMVGVLALFLGASGVFCEIQDALNSIWHVGPDTKSGIRCLVKERFLSFGIYCWKVCHWVLYREERIRFCLRSRWLFGGRRCMDLLLRVDPVFWRGIHASLREYVGFATPRRGPNQS